MEKLEIKRVKEVKGQLKDFYEINKEKFAIVDSIVKEIDRVWGIYSNIKSARSARSRIYKEEKYYSF